MQTDAIIFISLLAANQSKILLFFSNILVPIPPGIINKSNFGQSFMVKSLFTIRPPVQVMIFFFSVKVKTLNGQESR